MIDNYSFIPVAVCGVGSYRGPSPLLFSGPSMKRETQQIFHDCYVAQEKPMSVSKLTCEKFIVVRRGMKVQIQQIYFEL
jgi:hypothetical protein